MKVIGIILIIFGVLGLLIAGMMFGDIGVAAGIGSIVGILAGVGLIQTSQLQKKVEQLQKQLQ